jgi:hypothetical protein
MQSDAEAHDTILSGDVPDGSATAVQLAPAVLVAPSSPGAASTQTDDAGQDRLDGLLKLDGSFELVHVAPWLVLERNDEPTATSQVVLEGQATSPVPLVAAGYRWLVHAMPPSVVATTPPATVATQIWVDWHATVWAVVLLDSPQVLPVSADRSIPPGPAA